jgi:hypothetical protein
MSREALPNKRHGEIFKVQHRGQDFRFQVNEYPDGRLGEVFINANKPDSAIDSLAGDVAILLSLLLQHGVTPAVIGHALRRGRDGAAQSFIGTAADVLVSLDVALPETGAAE